MGIEGITLEYHGDVPVLGLHIVDQLPVDIELTPGDLLQTGHHPQSGGFSAAGGTNQNDEFPVTDVQIEVLYRQNAFVRHLEMALLFAAVRIYFFNML